MRVDTIFVRVLLIVAALLPFEHASASAEDDARRARQAELDRVCEAQRKPLLEAEHARFVEHCVQHDAVKDRAACERFYADFGEYGAAGFGMFRDLPACVEAFEFGRGDRRRR